MRWYLTRTNYSILVPISQRPLRLRRTPPIPSVPFAITKTAHNYKQRFNCRDIIERNIMTSIMTSMVPAIMNSTVGIIPNIIPAIMTTIITTTTTPTSLPPRIKLLRLFVKIGVVISFAMALFLLTSYLSSYIDPFASEPLLELFVLPALFSAHASSRRLQRL